MLNVDLRKKLLQISFENGLSHIPSALSMLDFWIQLDKMFSWGSKDALVVGKPYGALAYHLAWGDGLLAPLTGHDKNTMFVDATLANCLGVAAGLCMSKKFENVVCVVGDGCLQEGTILEAASFCGRCKSTLAAKLILAVDCNGWQCTSATNTTASQVSSIFASFGWKSMVLAGHQDNAKAIAQLMQFDVHCPTCLVFETTKGYGVSFMENDPLGWHYKKLDKQHLDQALAELDVAIAEETM